MGADKKSSRRMNSTYSPNSQPRIPTRVCQGRVVTTDLTTQGTNPNSKQHESATHEAKDLGNLWCLGQTVRGDWADGPQGHVGRSAKATRTTDEKRTVCTLPADGPRVTCNTRTVRDKRVDCPQTTCNQKQLF
jgi:hypothetical protein